MSYIGAEPTTAAFPFDQFSGTGAATSFTLTYAPASATSILVAISGVMQNPNLYSVIGTTLSFSPAPPAGTNNISVLYLGLPVIGSTSPGNTAFLSSTDLTATAGQTVFASAGSYTPGFVQVFRNGARLGNADFTATNGTTITLANAATAGDLVTIEYYTLTSLVNALPLTGGTVTGSTTFNSAVTINGATVSGFIGMKNRIINGNMVVDQRNAGASVATNGTNTVSLDRWKMGYAQNTKFTVQQNAGAITPPVGFSNYLGVVSTSAYTVGSGEAFSVYEVIEGYNIADLGWGTANASTVTLSFRVYSSLTGTFGGCLQNYSQARSYPFSYSVPVANTWTTISITIAGDTSGTWLTNNSGGIIMQFGIGVGATLSGTAGAWAGANYISATGATSVVGTSGATWYVTGVQLERGSNATSFEFIDYGRQLAQCQRYFVKMGNGGSGNGYTNFANPVAYTSGSNAWRFQISLPVLMRTVPSFSQTGNLTFLGVVSGATTGVGFADGGGNPIFGMGVTSPNAGSAGQVTLLRGDNDTTAALNFSAEL